MIGNNNKCKMHLFRTIPEEKRNKIRGRNKYGELVA